MSDMKCNVQLFKGAEVQLFVLKIYGCIKIQIMIDNVHILDRNLMYHYLETIHVHYECITNM